MKASELRIGNFYENQDGTLKSIGNERYSRIEKPEDLLFANLMQPVPITEGWLVTVGFSKNKNSFRHFGCIGINNVAIMIVIDSIKEAQVYISTDEFNFEQIYIRTVKYIHELQNLYFALTGKELTLNQGNQSLTN